MEQYTKKAVFVDDNGIEFDVNVEDAEYIYIEEIRLNGEIQACDLVKSLNNIIKKLNKEIYEENK